MMSLCLMRSEGAFASLSLSHYLPGGHAEMTASPTPKFYVVLAGEIVVTLTDGHRETLRRYDSCYIPPDEARQVTNEGNDVASMLVIIAT